MTPTSRPDSTTIDRERDVVTLINTFTIAPANQQTFLDAQHGEYRRLWGKIPGAIAANLHRGHGGTRAINYAQFRSLEEIAAWQASDLMKEHMPVIAPYIERAAPGLYRVEHVAARAPGAATIRVGGVAVIAVMTVDPDALDGVLATQRDAAELLLGAVSNARALALHRSVGPARPGPGAGPRHGGHGPAPGAPPPARSALYAVVDDEAAARALMEHAGYRASFTTENAQLRAVDSDIYTVVAVE